MTTFKFKYKKKLFWHTYRIVGFKRVVDSDRMSLFFEDGSILEVSEWSKCDCKLGADYFRMLHAKMESDAAMTIPLKNVAKS